MSTQLVSTGVTFPDATTQTTAGIPYVAPGTSGNVLKSNGTSWTSGTLSASGALLNIQYFATAGTSTYTPTAGTNSVIVEVLGAGGGSGSAQNTATFGGGGGGGGYARKRITSSFSGVTITVGAGGAAGSSGGSGSSGGTSSFGALVSATGGGGGTGSSATGISTAGGVGSSGDMNASGGYGSALNSSLLAGGAGAVYGSTSWNAVQTSGTNGVGYGSGAPGVYSSNNTLKNGGTGVNGLVIVYEYA